MGNLKKPWVFLCHKYETADGKRHDVIVTPKKGKQKVKKFTKLPDAKKYAENQSRSLGLKTYLADLPEGPKDIRVSQKPRKKPTKRKKKDPLSIF
jgi:hypothetical protein